MGPLMSSALPASPASPWPEGTDLGHLLGCVCLVPALWLLLGWRPSTLAGAEDLIYILLPSYQRLLESGGRWEHFLYDPAWLGGAKLHGLLGVLPVHQLLAALRVPAPAALNLTIFLIQVL